MQFLPVVLSSLIGLFFYFIFNGNYPFFPYSFWLLFLGFYLQSLFYKKTGAKFGFLIVLFSYSSVVLITRTQTGPIKGPLGPNIGTNILFLLLVPLIMNLIYYLIFNRIKLSPWIRLFIGLVVFTLFFIVAKDSITKEQFTAKVKREESIRKNAIKKRETFQNLSFDMYTPSYTPPGYKYDFSSYEAPAEDLKRDTVKSTTIHFSYKKDTFDLLDFYEFEDSGSYNPPENCGEVKNQVIINGGEISIIENPCNLIGKTSLGESFYYHARSGDLYATAFIKKGNTIISINIRQDIPTSEIIKIVESLQKRSYQDLVELKMITK